MSSGHLDEGGLYPAQLGYGLQYPVIETHLVERQDILLILLAIRHGGRSENNSAVHVNANILLPYATLSSLFISSFNINN
jgi:hypothetical protein